MAVSSPRPGYTKCRCAPGNWDALRSRYPPAVALQSEVAQSPVPSLPKTRVDLLPYDVLDLILEDVYQASFASRRLCRCSRKPDGSPWVYSAPWANPPPHSTIKNKSLAHRIVDTEYLRHTCSTFRAWGTHRITRSRADERLELDCTDLARYTEWTGQPWQTVLRHLCRDFPLLTPGSVVLYLGNPGDSSNVQRVIEMLQSEAKHSMAREAVGGVSFWDAPRSFKESLKEPLLRAISEAGLGKNEHSVPDENTALDTKIVDVLEQSVVQERRKELSAFADLYGLIGDRTSELSYTQIPVVLLWSGEPTICKYVAAITDCCQEIHFRQWDDMGDAHMNQYLCALGHLFSYSRHSPEHAFFARRGLFFGRLRRNLFRSERIAWEKNIQELRMLNRVDRVQNQKLRFQVKPVQSLDAELLPSFDATAMLSMSSAVGAHLSSLEIQGGAADNVSLYTILAALSSSQGCLTSLKFLPKPPHYASSFSTS